MGLTSAAASPLTLQHSFGDQFVFGSYGLGMMPSTPISYSLARPENRSYGQSWKLGVGQEGILFSGRWQDSVSVSMGLGMTAGMAQRGSLGAALGPSVGDGYSADWNPALAPRAGLLSLRPEVRPYDLALRYSLGERGSTNVALQFSQQFNAAGVHGARSPGLGLNAWYRF